MMQGARKGTMTGLRRLVAAAMSRDLCAFVVPGPDVARARGLDFLAVGLHLSATPRHANVLLIVGPLVPTLVEAATIAYAQMPRPRAILTLAAGDITPLPVADATGALSQAGLVAALADLRGAMAAGAFLAEVTDFDAASLGTRIEYTCPMHPEVISDQPGNCPKCGMTLMPKETSATGHAGHQTQGHPPAAADNAHERVSRAAVPGQYTCPMHPDVVSDQPGSCPKCGMILVRVEDNGGHDHSGHESHAGHGGHDHAAAAPEQYTCPMHPDVVSDQPGSCPKCGMFLVRVEDNGGHDHSGHESHAGHGGHDHAAAAPEQYTCPMHPDVVSDQPGSCPKCGMILVRVEDNGGHDHSGHESHAGHGGHDHAATTPEQYTCPMHPEVISDQPGNCPKCGMILVKTDAAGEPDLSGHGKPNGHAGHNGHSEPGGHDHGKHSGDGGHAGHAMQGEPVEGVEAHFMSMVDLTRDMPASPDGLRMEWIKVPFGPFFPGLPGGLGLTLTLDGDTVVEARAQSRVGSVLGDGLDPTGLADRMAELTPLAPVAMRQLACLALEAAAGRDVSPDRAKARAAAVERERIASHLNWLAGFGAQVGLIWLERRAAALQQTLRDADIAEISARAGPIRALLHRVRATPLMRAKLSGIGRLDSATVTTGPVARAAGVAADRRTDNPVYTALGFEIVTQSSGNARARLHQRCDEISQSLDLIARAGTVEIPRPEDIGGATGHGMASVETPRGVANCHLMLSDGKVASAQIETAFAAQSGLIDNLTAQSELADALTAIGSLDLDPWEIAP